MAIVITAMPQPPTSMLKIIIVIPLLPTRRALVYTDTDTDRLSMERRSLRAPSQLPNRQTVRQTRVNASTVNQVGYIHISIDGGHFSGGQRRPLPPSGKLVRQQAWPFSQPCVSTCMYLDSGRFDGRHDYCRRNNNNCIVYTTVIYVPCCILCTHSAVPSICHLPTAVARRIREFCIDCYTCVLYVQRV